MTLSPEQISLCTYATNATATKYADCLNAAMDKYEINTPLRQAHFLSQLGHESESLIYTEELGGEDYFRKYDKRADLGNTHAGDGFRYKGRGFIQITGRYNYVSYGNSIQIDFESNPELLAQIPYCADSSGWYWNMKNLNIFADQNKTIEITRRINGGQTGLNDRLNRLRVCKKVLGIIA
jgi:putative chitinase